jgi:hypothetical protein
VNQQWVCLWSARQNSLHVETLDAMLQSNARALGENRSNDYVPVAIGSKDLAEAWANRIRGVLATRAPAA